jgi:O-antigen/teichoic acid export membrane protein
LRTILVEGRRVIDSIDSTEISARARILRACSVLRLRPFDTATEQGRADERHRRLVLTTLSSLAARAVSVLTVVVSVPLTVNYLGSERYGLWMTISSISAVLSFADLGLGCGLVNAIADAHGKNDTNRAAQYTASAFYLLCSIAALLAVVFFLAYPWVPWQRVFNIKSPGAIAEAAPAMAVFTGAFLLSIPLGTADRIMAGYQEGFLGSLWAAGGNLLGLLGVLTAVRFRAGLPWLVFAMNGGPVLAGAVNGGILFGLRRPALFPRWRNFRRDASGHLLRLGLLFFVMQIASAVGWGSDNLVIAQALGQTPVAEYAATRRMFSVVPMFVGMVLAPLWPAYGEAIARADVAWVRRTLIRSTVATFLGCGLPCLALVLLGRPLMAFWVGGSIVPSWLLLTALGIMTTLGQTGAALSTFLNGASAMRLQTVLSVLMAASNLPISILLTRKMGASGVVWGTIVACTVFSWIPMLFYVPAVLERVQRAADEIHDTAAIRHED